MSNYLVVPGDGVAWQDPGDDVARAVDRVADDSGQVARQRGLQLAQHVHPAAAPGGASTVFLLLIGSGNIFEGLDHQLFSVVLSFLSLY